MGEFYALLSAASFGVAGAAVAKGAPEARGDNGVFLSIVLTCALSGLLWVAFGIELGTIDGQRTLVVGIAFFVAAGLLATVLTRQARTCIFGHLKEHLVNLSALRVP